MFDDSDYTDFNAVFQTNYSLRVEVCNILRDWGTRKASPPRPELGICFNLKMLYPNYTFGEFVGMQSMSWPLHKHKGLIYTNLPVCDQGHSLKWENPARLDLCLFLADVLTTNQLKGTNNG